MRVASTRHYKKDMVIGLLSRIFLMLILKVRRKTALLSYMLQRGIAKADINDEAIIGIHVGTPR